MEGPKWRRKVGKLQGKYPYVTLPVEFSDWIGEEVELYYKDGMIIIRPVHSDRAETEK